MQMYHSLRCKQIDMSTANDLKSIFPTESKFGRLKVRGVIMIIEFEVSFTPPNVYLSILQAYAGQILSLLRVNRTSETLSEPESTHIFESNVIWDKTTQRTTGSISSKLINQSTLEAKQNETHLEDLSDDNRSHGKLQKRTSRSKSTRISKCARRYTVQRTIEITVEDNSALI